MCVVFSDARHKHMWHPRACLPLFCIKTQINVLIYLYCARFNNTLTMRCVLLPAVAHIKNQEAFIINALNRRNIYVDNPYFFMGSHLFSHIQTRTPTVVPCVYKMQKCTSKDYFKHKKLYLFTPIRRGNTRH